MLHQKSTKTLRDISKRMFRIYLKDYHVYAFGVPLASVTGCVGYLRGDHPNREVCSHYNVLSQRLSLNGLTVNDSCPQL